MKFYFNIYCILISLIPIYSFGQSKDEVTRWEKQAQQVSIIRDNWGIPHIYGKTDADAVFGLMYAQCEDDFPRIELNYIEKLGRLSEIKGETKLAADLINKILLDTLDAKADYQTAPEWLKKLLNAHSDAINYYLYKHPQVKPQLLTRFQPWFHLLWTDGSIGAISTADITEADVKNMYLETGDWGAVSTLEQEKLTGSNGFAFSPSVTQSQHAMLYINPHVTFYFRPEVHIVSEEGLNAYGAVTWGQFFVYQGFNEHCGWMHTSSYTDVADTYLEKTYKKDSTWLYEFEHEQKQMHSKKITLRYLQGNKYKEKSIKILYTLHGPVMANRSGQLISLRSNNRSLISLTQSWKRIKAKNFDEYKEIMSLLGNTSNNTVYADDKGNIAYWHGNFVPIRDLHFDWAKPVDGTTQATSWKGAYTVEQTIHVYNPSSGWIQNCNSTPFTCSGESSPKKSDYPIFMAPDGENFRGITAARLLTKQKKYSLDDAITLGYNSYMSAFELLIPALVADFKKLSPSDSLYSILKEPIQLLEHWDLYSTESSIPTALAVEWAERLLPHIAETKISDPYNLNTVEKMKAFLTAVPERELCNIMTTSLTELKKRFGTWKIAWGEINRYQRLSGDIDLKYDDHQKSLPVAFTSSVWGTLPSFVSQRSEGTNKRYGNRGNSFICIVEFGEKIKAKSLLTGGENSNPLSKHFNDQAELFCKGKFKEVLFYKEDVLQHIEKTYHPGEK